MKFNASVKTSKGWREINFEIDINEDEAMNLFNIKDRKDTYIDSQGKLELHSDKAYIYTDLQVGENLSL